MNFRHCFDTLPMTYTAFVIANRVSDEANQRKINRLLRANALAMTLDYCHFRLFDYYNCSLPMTEIKKDKI